MRMMPSERNIINMIKLIGLGGLAGAGKSTAAQYLETVHGFDRVSFATMLKGEVAHALANRERAFQNADLPQEIRDLLGSLPANSNVWEKPTPPALRRLLQLWGTEYRRAQDPHYWVKRLPLYPDNIVVDDVRFLNEVKFLRVLDCQIWNVTGRAVDTGAPQHVSENDLTPFSDLVIMNEGSLQDLYDALDTALHLTTSGIMGSRT